MAAPDGLDLLLDAVSRDSIAGASFREDMIRSEVAAVLEDARREYGLSFKQLAKKSGVDPAQLRRIFQRERSGAVPLYALVRVADVLDVDLQVTAEHIDTRMERSHEKVEHDTAELGACMRALNVAVKQNVRLRSELSDLALHLGAMSGQLRPAWVAERLRVLLED